jgi:heme-degrading monooxygenase HmoA
MTTVITVYDLPDQAAPPAPLGEGHTLHRAVGEPAAYTWIDLGESATPDEAALVVTGAEGRPGALTGRYEAFHVNDRAAEMFDPSRSDDSVLFVNCMRFAPEQHDAAFMAWEQVNRYMVRKPGYRWHRLHRRLDDHAPFGLINVVEWESPQAWRAAHDAGFRALTEGELPFTAHPTLCRAVAAHQEVAR